MAGSVREAGWKVKIGLEHAFRSAAAGLSCEADRLCYERGRWETDPAPAIAQPFAYAMTGSVL